MKLILLPLLVLFCFTAAAYPKKKKFKKQSEAITRVEFESFTRRASVSVIITKDSAICITRTSKKFILTKPSDWNGLLKTVKGVQLPAIPSWDAPSRNHEFDGAAHAKIIIATKNKSYQTKTFDGGNPMKQLKDLYDFISVIQAAIEENGKEYSQ